MCIHVWEQGAYGNPLYILLSFAVSLNKGPSLGIRNLSRMIKMLSVLIVVRWKYVCAKTILKIHLKWMHYIVYELCLNTVDVPSLDDRLCDLKPSVPRAGRWEWSDLE